ncbi:MAG: hypothetical protein JXQ73_33215 [Phycisphaerae bacterium]|nr:hypothetical protein [Phycisphaerae bacterium]
MSRNHLRTKPPAWTVAACWALFQASPFALAAEEQSQSMRALIEQALDQQVNFTIDKQPLASAFELISKQTGVRLTIRPQVVELLPYGKQTLVSAKIEGMSLREGLVGKEGMLWYIGMTLQVRDSDVAIEPVDALRRVCRRATWGELKLLHHALTTPWSAEAAAKIPLNFQVRAEADPKKQLMDQAAKAGEGTIAEVLETACNRLGWTWYPWDNWIVVLSKKDQAERFLEKPITVRYNHVALADVFADLARQADLKIRLEPGVLMGLPVEARESFGLMMREATIRTALEMIGASTGLAYEIKPDTEEILIKHTKASAAAATQQAPAISIRSQDPIVGKVTVPGKSGVYQFEFFIRESDLPEHINELRKQKIRDAIKIMEKELKP